jgi:ribosomal protein L11 methyltransferase
VSAGPDRWLVLSVEAPPPGSEPLLAGALRRLGARAVERERGRVVAWLPPPRSVEKLLARARASVAATTGQDSDPDVTWRWESYGDWRASRAREAAALRVTDRVMVAPPGANAPDAHTLVVRIAPGAAFGGADHPTTRACLELLEPRVQQGDRVLDVGTGSGVLAIAAALLGASHVTAIEADPLACREARANVALNEVAGRVDVVEARARPGFLPGGGPFDGVTANLEGAHLLPLLPTLASAVVPNGWLAVGGLVAPERDAALEAAHAGGLEPVEERRHRGWWSAVFGSALGRSPRR